MCKEKRVDHQHHAISNMVRQVIGKLDLKIQQRHQPGTRREQNYALNQQNKCKQNGDAIAVRRSQQKYRQRPRHENREYAG